MSARATSPAELDPVADLRARLYAVLAGCIPAGSSVALLDFPSYPNPGDSAIWLGTLAALRRLGCRIAYVCDQGSYSYESLERRLPAAGTILLQGGGSFGDIWPWHQSFRETVVCDFPGRPIVQLPVSVSFSDTAALQRAQASLNGHERLTLLCRDETSLEFARRHFAARALLCPDAALGLTPGSRPKPAADVVMLLRDDKEGVRQVPHLAGARVLDWSSAPGRPDYGTVVGTGWDRRWRLSLRLGSAANRGPGYERLAQPALAWIFRSMARQRVGFGYEVVGSGWVLVTDRLHGHILALLLGVPHVIFESGHGKVRSFHETFTQGADGVVLCEDPQELEPLVRDLLERVRT
jgi:exopolysaccharide biosynthesis predicted pyruvyltransferase EpsI